MKDTALTQTTSHRTFDFGAMTGRERYKLLIGTVVPRPIAWVTTVDEQGRVNAAPFSFFNVLSADPAILAIGVENYPDMSFKDTGHNIRMTGEFTVNIVDYANLDAMNVTAIPFPRGVDEVKAAGLTAIPGDKIAAPRIAESPIAFECRRYVTLEVGRSREIVLGEVVAAHVRADLVDDNLHINGVALDAIGRMGGHGYSRSSDQFNVPPVTLAEWEARQG